MKTQFLPPGLATLAVSSLFLSTAGSASAQPLQSWQFEEPALTVLTGATNSGPGVALFDTPLAGITANGTGSLVVTYNNTLVSGRSFADIPDITSGIVQLDVNVAGWNFVGVGAVGPLLEVGLSAATTGNNAAIRTAHIYFDADNVVGATLAGVAGGGGSASTPGIQDQVFAVGSGGLLRTTPITFRLIANFDTRAYSVSNSDTGYTVLSTGTIATGKAGAFVSIRALDDFTIGGTGGHFTIDSITLTAIPEPSSYAAILGLAAFGLVALRRRRA